MLPIDEASQVEVRRSQPCGYDLQSRKWAGQRTSAEFEAGAVSVCNNQRPRGVMGKYGVLTVDAQGGYSYALHTGISKGIDAGQDAFVYVGEEACVYMMEPLWFATEVFHINNDPSGRSESHRVVVSIAVR